jgi:DDE superfamily endonuclease
LLGDSAYPLYLNLMTPYRDNGHLTAVQRYFNRVQSSCRVSIEQTFGIMKQRFRQLFHLKLRGHARIAHFIRACCVLHNIADLDDLQVFIEEENVPDEQPDNDHANGNHGEGNDLRDEVARQIFLRRR